MPNIDFTPEEVSLLIGLISEPVDESAMEGEVFDPKFESIYSKLLHSEAK